MKILRLATVVLLSGAGAAPVDTEETQTLLETDALVAQGVLNLRSYSAKHGYPNPQTCTLKNVAVRREWSTFTTREKKNYIAAVQCISKKPSQTPSTLASGAKTRYDDFVATHINQTMSIHGTGNFLSWHRYFTWAYEQTLRTECGYTGFQPYYSWPRWSNDPAKSPVFDGSETSISGDGELIAGRNNTCIPAQEYCAISLPPGNGGGCVKSGPFKNFTVNLGPVTPVVADPVLNPDSNGLGYNPRCLRRDISKAAAQGWTKDSDVVSLLKNSANFLNFTTTMQGDFPNGFLGVHTSGHFTIGGDPGGDLFASPADPAFYLHHAMIDRVYWTWQNLNLQNRLYEIGGTITLNDQPPSRNTTLEDTIGLGFVGFPDLTIREASSTLAGPFCYIYA
ncbi:Di-copper centre-containing protein [Massarina eburnea CBS 473.64]|uniref:Di-copper centre-containing protein n=1 Tax=Massarina eburnea CBS 473.64 TaxID=1395130 RepID=A0A6A6SCR1_9PLEO|nr:Di-copper centre-containing protein [Massarina eburnea CBS 473.64]